MTDNEKRDRIQKLTECLKIMSQLENDFWAEKRQLMDETYQEK